MADVFTPPSAGMVQRFKYFSASGWFYPSAGLLAAGGVVDLDLRGGGSGVHGTSGGGSSRLLTKVVVSGPVAVTIGAGGATNTAGSASSFGSTTCPGGVINSFDADSPGGAGGRDGLSGMPSFYGANSGWTAAKLAYGAGGGGSGAGSGGGGTVGINGDAGWAGSCLATWWEKA